jgi:hypothetical protein
MSSMADDLDQPDHLEPEPATLAQPVDAGGSVEVRRAAMITASVGIAHAVLLVLAFWLVRSTAAGVNATDADIVVYYEDADNRRRIIAAGLYLLPFSGIAFIWFVVALRMWTSGSAKRINMLLANVQLAAGIIYVTLILSAGASYALLAATYELTDEPMSPEIARVFPRLGSVLFLTLAMRMAAMVVFTTSGIGRSTGILPRWFGAVGIVVGITLLLSASLNPLLILVFPTWLTVLSIFLLRRAREVPRDVVLPPPAGRDERGALLRRLAKPGTDGRD